MKSLSQVQIGEISKKIEKWVEEQKTKFENNMKEE